MRKADVGNWLTAIHGTPDKRGMEGIETERLAIYFVESSKKKRLELGELRLIYEKEAIDRSWSVNYDFQALRVAWQDFRHERPALGMVMDYIFYSPGTVRLIETKNTEWMDKMRDRAMGGKPDVRAGIRFKYCHGRLRMCTCAILLREL